MRPFIIIALTNKEEEFSGTRHNIGSVCVRAFINSYNLDVVDYPTYSEAHTTIKGEDVRVIIPRVPMNVNSKVLQHLPYKDSVVVLVHDDITLSVGKIRVSKGITNTLHNGVLSFETYNEATYRRVRVGVGMSDSISTNEYVLQPFKKGEIDIPLVTSEVIDALNSILVNDIEKVQSDIN